LSYSHHRFLPKWQDGYHGEAARVVNLRSTKNISMTKKPGSKIGSKAVPSRRKFLIASIPSKLALTHGVEIEQGYIVWERGQELRARREGREYFLSSRTREGGSLTGHEISITKTQFAKIWPFTLGRRITRIRHAFKLGRFRMKIDEFTGEHAPLRLAEIFFPDAESGRAFQKPDFLGEEVTRREEYQTAEMAIHGVPEPSGMCQLGILPYTFIDRRLHLLLITSSSGSRWILPKGRQEPDMTPHEVAVMEAVEEAGVLGTLRQDLRTRCRMADGRFLQLYAMKISKLLKSWPEENVRRRRLFPISDALEILGDPGVSKAVRRLAASINK